MYCKCTLTGNEFLKIARRHVQRSYMAPQPGAPGHTRQPASFAMAWRRRGGGVKYLEWVRLGVEDEPVQRKHVVVAE